MYGISDNNKLFKIFNGGDYNGWMIKECKTNESDGLITDVLQIDKSTWYYSTNPEDVWIELNKGE